ncbi:MAG: glycoside hydrolase [Bradymonadaceae bacterium]
MADRYLQFVWHFHQPYYGTPDHETKRLPWVRLHASKAYYDLGRMLEEFPDVRCTVNFSGSLLEQIREYVEVGTRDSWWYLTQKPAADLTRPDKLHLLEHFFALDRETSVAALPAYDALLESRDEMGKDRDPEAFDEQDYRDLQVLFNLAWFGFAARQERPVVRGLREKGENFSESEKQALLEQQIEVMQLLVPMYRRLHRRGQVEVSVSPMYHPILPLLIDSESARRAMPSVALPDRFRARDDAGVQIDEARRVAREVLSIETGGVWPPEGAVSPETMELLDAHGVDWCASDEGVLAKSRGDAWERERDLYRPWSVESSDQVVFFRDRELSDRIGFVYGDQEADEAVDDFLQRVRDVPVGSGDPPVISVVLDGENPWDHYPNDGKAFLTALFERISAADDIVTTVPSEAVEQAAEPAALSSLHSGSWIDSNYRVWIGDSEENRAWELLEQTRRALSSVDESDELTETERKLAWEAIYMAEGSDWFWWYGEDFSSTNDSDFDRLFRDQLRYVYNQLGASVPAEIDEPIAEERLQEVDFEPPQRLIRPRIDGRSEYYYEWSGSGVYRNTGAHGSMYENTRYVEEIRIGFDLDYLYVRIDPGSDLVEDAPGVEFRTKLRVDDRTYTVVTELQDGGHAELFEEEAEQPVPLELVAFEASLEFAVPFGELAAAPGDLLELRIGVWDGRLERERHPLRGTFELSIPDDSFEARNWWV